MFPYKLDTAVDFHGKVYRVNMAFDNILRMQEMQRDEMFTDMQKINLSLHMLLTWWSRRHLIFMSDVSKIDLFKLIIEQLVTVRTRPTGDNRILMDFTQDASYIYASFWQAYGVDLQKQLGKLDWRKFISLMQGLPKDTKIRDVMSIRAADEPVANKYNHKEIHELRKAKAYYALEFDEKQAQEMFQAGVDKLTSQLLARAIPPQQPPNRGGRNG